jgi:hypothetical protein
MKSVLKGVCLGLGLLALQACAFVDQEIELGYTPQGYEPKGSGTVVAAAPKAAYTNHLNPEGRLIIGTVKNGFGSRTADVLPVNDPAAWIANAVASELELAGYTVEKSASTVVDDAARAIEVKVTKVFTDQDTGMMTIGAISTLFYELTVKSNGTVVATVPVTYSADIAERSIAGTGSLKAAALKEALEKSLSTAMPQVLEALQGAPTS